MRLGSLIAMTAAGIALLTPATAAAQGQCLPPKGVYTAQAEFANATYLFSGQLLDSVAALSTARDRPAQEQAVRNLVIGNLTRGATYAGATEQYVLKVTTAMLTEPPQCEAPAKKRRVKRR